MRANPIYVGGEFRTTAEVIEVRNPYNSHLLAMVCLAGPSDLEDAIIKAQQAFITLRAMPSYKRYNILMQIFQQLENQKNLLATILAGEAAKPIKLAIAEIERAAETFKIAAEESKRLPKEYISLDWTQAGDGKEGFVKYFPIGLVAGISPFNFPMNLAVHKIAPAIAAGCPIVLKPSCSTPLSTLELAKIIDQTDLPKGAVSILPMDRKTGNQLVTDVRFKLLSFTGSPAVGWKMKQQAGKKKVILELGGNAGVIVSDSCDMDWAVRRCVSGGFSYAGQVCIHAQRIYVHEGIFNNFTDAFSDMTEHLKKGDPLDTETDITTMIDETNARRVEKWVNEAVAGGAQVLTGGKRNGAFFEPTVLTSTTPDMKVCAFEVFGPVVAIEPFSDFKQAVSQVNAGNYGLQAGIFTNRIDEMNHAFEHLEVGGVIINDVPTFRVDHMPYGGVKDSGLGREGVKYAIYDMMEARIMVRNFC
ncbi:MAG: aldehyde dehydrogenase family protein [Bacteroidales bacterium]|nr:aldehyde dehydrogenase family protein [Bacteroidales bacterium]MDZ4204267.1 aldehyde dehydrogenase family protein [Bacteroidales bacterium]